jgi:hypothetical protein
MGLFYKFWRLGINTLVNMQLEGTTEMNVNFSCIRIEADLAECSLDGARC